MFEGIFGVDIKVIWIFFFGFFMKLVVFEDMFGWVFNGSGNFIDNGLKVFVEDYFDINGE